MWVRFGSFVAAIMLLSAGNFASAQEEQMTLDILVKPANEARAVKLGGNFSDRTIADKVDDGRVVATVTPMLPLKSRALYVDWSDDSQTSFPVFLAPNFSGQQIEIHLLRDKDWGELSDQEIRQYCLGLRPDSLSSAFLMFYRCRDSAIGLERRLRKGSKVYRHALHGWFLANYWLYTGERPISPYGPDRSLVERLEEIVESVRTGEYPAESYFPLRIGDVREFLKLVNEEQIRLVGTIPELLKRGFVREASDINTSALKTLEKSDTVAGASAYGVNRELLEKNSAYIGGLVASP